MTASILNNDNDFTPIALKDVKAGEFVTRKPNTNTVYTKSYYDRATKTYSLNDYNDHCRQVFLKGSTIVYVGFTY